MDKDEKTWMAILKIQGIKCYSFDAEILGVEKCFYVNFLLLKTRITFKDKVDVYCLYSIVNKKIIFPEFFVSTYEQRHMMANRYIKMFYENK